ncbi:MAG: 50S ribosomal protein L10 [Phycisphaeraceae bacterium]|nr:50S ribosomal protein L10 [Phycisphaerales bacterium]MCA9305504.1 50S ribosomal protein L10 [Phycisphaerales bacterium]MCB9843921.1 50S ribosomal protein L10 [Phycisphaeraceae bacterium]
MSKVVKKLLMRDYTDRLDGVEDALLISVRGVPALDNNRFRNELAKKDIKVTVIRNNLAKNSLKDGPLENLIPLLQGPSALAYGAESVVDVAREVMAWAKKLEQLELKGAVIDGELFSGKAGVERLSKLPTREEALAQTVTLILSPARKLVGAVKGPGSRVMSVIKSVEEKLEKGETIAKVG